MPQLHESITAHIAETAQQLRTLTAYGPVRVTTREPRYTEDRGFRPLQADPDQRRKFALGHNALIITDTDGNLDVEVNTPLGPRQLPLEAIEDVAVDHPHHDFMPLSGKQMMSLVLMPWAGRKNVLRWTPRAIEHFDGSHSHTVFGTEIDPKRPEVGIVRGYDISTPWDRQTSLQTAKEAERPYGLYYISKLGAASIPDVTVVTSRMGYRDFDRSVTVLPPKQPTPLPERPITMLDVINPDDEAVYEKHLARLDEVACRLGKAAVAPLPLTQMAVDDTFLYMSHD